jgi:hypothetical protein
MMLFNHGDGSNKSYYNSSLPSDYQNGWTHVILSIDRDNNTVTMYYDFGAVVTNNYSGVSIEQMAGDPLATAAKLAIGDVPNGGYGKYVNAAIDELMVFDGAFDASDARALAKYYGVEILVFGANADIAGMGTGTVNKSVRDPNTSGKLETPLEGSDKHVSNFIDKELSLYVNFDGESNTTVTGQNFSVTQGSGSASYETGVFGEALKLENGAYAAVDGIELGTGSYTVSFWVKMENLPAAGDDPCLIATKNWSSGNDKGFLIATKIYNGQSQMTMNFGNGSSRADGSTLSPTDMLDGWMHVTVVIDKNNNLAHMYLDFKLVKGNVDISIFANESVTQTSKLVIAQQLNGAYSDKLNASFDELMVFEGALSEEEIRSLSAYYGLETIVFGN